MGAQALVTYQKAMNFTAQIMGIMPKVVFNILLGSFDEVIPELQSHLNPNYGNCPSHSQIAKDSFTHPLNKLSAELAKEAVFTVGKKFKEGMNGHELSEFVALTYFVHPSSKNAEWSRKKIEKWKNNPANSKALESLKYATIYEHAHHEAKTISDAGVKKIKEIMKFFKEQTK